MKKQLPRPMESEWDAAMPTASEIPDKTTTPTSDPSKVVYQLKIGIKGIRPPVWRRVQISSDATFYQLHQLIQKVFEWGNCHLHDFSFRNPLWHNREMRIVGLPPGSNPKRDPHIYLDELGMEGEYIETKVQLHEIWGLELKTVKYTYDFGDRWVHQITREKELPKAPKIKYPQLMNSKGITPDEDSRGC